MIMYFKTGKEIIPIYLSLYSDIYYSEVLMYNECHIPIAIRSLNSSDDRHGKLFINDYYAKKYDKDISKEEFEAKYPPCYNTELLELENSKFQEEKRKFENGGESPTIALNPMSQTLKQFAESPYLAFYYRKKIDLIIFSLEFQEFKVFKFAEDGVYIKSGARELFIPAFAFTFEYYDGDKEEWMI